MNNTLPTSGKKEEEEEEEETGVCFRMFTLFFMSAWDDGSPGLVFICSHFEKDVVPVNWMPE